MSRPAREDFGILLNLAFNRFKDELNASLATAGYDDIGPSFGYVFRLLADGSRSLTEVAAHLQMTAPGALKVVEDMVAKGYVSRSADAQDKRVKQLALTARGKAALKLARQFHDRFEKGLAKRLGEPSLLATRSVLESIAAVPADAVASARPRPLQSIARNRS